EGLPVRAAGPGLARPDELSAVVDGAAGYLRLDAEEVSASSVGLLAEGLFLHHREFVGPTPLYLRSPDVTVSAGPKRVSR
ncbi:MAG TPA: tRNA (adenosine(37)-N6)-threonylcarbamoyltransferase complex dimerization subunit type 1 TsaB, partial [Lacisediminihabitans sp.]